MENFNYAQHLKILKTFSIQQRHERYKSLYIYKIKEVIVPNNSNTYGFRFRNHERRGWQCKVPKYPLRGKAIKAREDSFALTASNL